VLGGDEAIGRIRFARFRADASGPGGEFGVMVLSGADGEARIEFSPDPGLSAGITRERGWVRADEDDGLQALSDTLESFVRGHELLMIALHPDRRYGPLRYAGEQRFGDVPAIRLDGIDRLGGPIQPYYSLPDTVPLGFQLIDHLRGRGPVTTSLFDWRPAGDVRLPNRARFVQGSEVFEYTLAEIETRDSIDVRAFEPAPEPAG
jgi:hypothetical protein